MKSVCAVSEILSTKLGVYGQGTSHNMEPGPRVQVGIKQASRCRAAGGEEGNLSLAPLLP